MEGDNEKSKEAGTSKKKGGPAAGEGQLAQGSRSPEKKEARQGQPAPKRAQDRRGGRENALVRNLKAAGQFLREARMELKKVKWPTRKELFASTAVVIFLVLVISLFLGLVDFGLIKVIKNILR
jgi:preprotein translocase subunit SecE